MDQDKTNDYWLGLIYDSLSGNIDEDSQQKLATWLSASNHNQAYYDELALLYRSLEFANRHDHHDVEEAYETFWQTKSTTEKPKLTWWKYGAAAAALLLVFLAGMYADRLQSHPINPISITKIVAQKGAQAQTILADGTEVWLNADSEIQLVTEFGRSERRIKLIGEAFFRVSKNEDIPFVVETAQFDVKVHGTSFNVMSYPGDKSEVALIEGIVEVLSKRGESYIMKPDQVVRYDTGESQFTLTQGIDETILAWKEHNFLFKDKKFSEIITTLERLFDVDIHVHSKDLMARKLTGEFENGETIQEILEVISSLGEFSYKIKGRRVDIY